MATIREMSANIHKLDKFEGVGFRRWQKKIHFLLPSLSAKYVLSTLIIESVENETPEATRKRNKWEEMIIYISRKEGVLIFGLDSLKHKDDMNVEQLGAHLWIKEYIRVQDGQKDI